MLNFVKKRMTNLQQRTITALVFGLFVLGSTLYGPLAQGLTFSFFMIVGLWEFYKMFDSHSIVKVSKELGIFIGIFIYTLLVGISMKFLPVISITVIFPMFFLLVLTELWKREAQPLINISVLVFGIIYIVIPFYLTIDLNLRNNQYLPSVAGMILLIWTNDTMAYFIGRFFGKHKLFERISPKKTWEGSIGGIVFTVLVGYFIGTYVNQGQTFFWLIAACIIAPCAIFGDLLESLFKRSLALKDSGKLLPGHGGVLDRFDAALFTIPFFYCWHMLYYYW